MRFGPLVYAALDDDGQPLVLVPRSPVMVVRNTPPMLASIERELAIERAVDSAVACGIPVRVEGPLEATDVIALRS